MNIANMHEPCTFSISEVSHHSFYRFNRIMALLIVGCAIAIGFAMAIITTMPSSILAPSYGAIVFWGGILLTMVHVVSFATLGGSLLSFAGSFASSLSLSGFAWLGIMGLHIKTYDVAAFALLLAMLFCGFFWKHFTKRFGD